MIFNKKRGGQAEAQLRPDQDRTGKGTQTYRRAGLTIICFHSIIIYDSVAAGRRRVRLVSEREGPDMTDLYFFSLTVINCFVLGFMCMIVNFSETLFPRQRRTFLLTFILIGVISGGRLII